MNTAPATRYGCRSRLATGKLKEELKTISVNDAAPRLAPLGALAEPPSLGGCRLPAQIVVGLLPAGHVPDFFHNFVNLDPEFALSAKPRDLMSGICCAASFQRNPASLPKSGLRPITASAGTACGPIWSCSTIPAWSMPAVALDRLCAPGSEVSAHYLVLEDGRVIQMVPESRRAWHAGRFVLGGRNRYQFLLDRHRDRQSRSRLRLSRFSQTPDRGGDRVVPRHPDAQHHSRRSACWRIPTSRRRASRIRARNFPGGRSGIRGSVIGFLPPRSPRAARCSRSAIVATRLRRCKIAQPIRLRHHDQRQLQFCHP